MMAERPFWPDGDQPAEWETSGAGHLARMSLLSPEPSPDAEQKSRERILAQFQEDLPLLRNLQENPKPPAWAERVSRAVRRLLGR